MTEKVEGIVLVPESSREYLNDHQLVDYRDHRRKFVKWALNIGKDPVRRTGDGVSVRVATVGEAQDAPYVR